MPGLAQLRATRSVSRCKGLRAGLIILGNVPRAQSPPRLGAAPVWEKTPEIELLISGSRLHAPPHNGWEWSRARGKDGRDHLSVLTPRVPAAQGTLQWTGGEGPAREGALPQSLTLKSEVPPSVGSPCLNSPPPPLRARPHRPLDSVSQEPTTFTAQGP